MVNVTVQYAVEHMSIPDEEKFLAWAAAIVSEGDKIQEVAMRIVDEHEMLQLNSQYRNKSCPTNVLSFPANLHEDVDIPFLGDVIICAPVIEKEASEQGKTADSHWAHMTVHGILHLQGYDHMSEAEATEMEQLEINILQNLGFANPYI